jgi:hypothetical protein
MSKTKSHNIPIKKSILLFFSLIGLISCDPYGGYEYWIENKSDSLIYVTYKLIDNDSILCKKLDKGQEIKLVQFDTHNGLYDKGLDYLFTFCDSLAIYSDTTNKILIDKDISMRKNWTYEQDETRSIMNAGNNIYRFLIKNEDLK